MSRGRRISVYSNLTEIKDLIGPDLNIIASGWFSNWCWLGWTLSQWNDKPRLKPITRKMGGSKVYRKTTFDSWRKIRYSTMVCGNRLGSINGLDVQKILRQVRAPRTPPEFRARVVESSKKGFQQCHLIWIHWITRFIWQIMPSNGILIFQNIVTKRYQKRKCGIAMNLILISSQGSTNGFINR